MSADETRPETIVSDEDKYHELDGLANELSLELIRVPADDVPGAIDRTLSRLGEAIELERVTLIAFSEGTSLVESAHSWSRTPALAVDLAAGRIPLPWAMDRLALGEAVLLDRIPEDIPPEARTPATIEYLRDNPVRSAIALPIPVAGQQTCALVLEAVRYGSWPQPVIARLQLLATSLAGALHRSRQEQALRQSRENLARLTAQLENESDHVHPERGPSDEFVEIVGESRLFREALARVEEVAATNSTVLLLGETGTGKELFARALHARSQRRASMLVAVNCAALPPTLIESELFGHERGAFTGAVSQRQGRFELAHRGTLFLDEIGDLPMELQAKLLRVLEEGDFERVGSSHSRKVDVRVITATHRDLELEVAEGRFRRDLYYRLSVFPIRIPPLRERREDIPLLVWHLIHKWERTMHRHIKRVPTETMRALERYSWPGNVRELENVIERALIHSTGAALTLLDDAFLKASVHQIEPEDKTLSSVEKAYIEEVLASCGGRISGSGNAAERLGLHPNTLRFRMKKLGIVRPEPTFDSRTPRKRVVPNKYADRY
jgi:transcriptional regulator with GAF, ATPase, and Fis domain